MPNLAVVPSSEPATFMYMSNTVGVAELRQNLSKYLRRVEEGERLVVTDRNRPVAELGPVPTMGSRLDQLIAEGKVKPPKRRGSLPQPLKLDLGGDPEAMTRALEEVRGYR
jgi:prevent-host-death family protein